MRCSARAAGAHPARPRTRSSASRSPGARTCRPPRSRTASARQLELALALVTEPRLLLLDEPAAGLSSEETERFAEMLAALPRELTILLIEHDLDLVFQATRTVTVLHLGRIIASGTPEQIRANDEVHSVYIGGKSEEELFVEDGGPDGAA